MKDNIFGIPFDVRTAQEATQAAADGTVYYAVARCTELSIRDFPDPIRARILLVACGACNESCWLDPHSEIRGALIRCTQCLPTGLTLSTTPETVAEIRRYHPGA